MLGLMKKKAPPPDKFRVTFVRPFVLYHSRQNFKEVTIVAGEYTMVIQRSPFGKEVEKKGGPWISLQGSPLGINYVALTYFCRKEGNPVSMILLKE